MPRMFNEELWSLLAEVKESIALSTMRTASELLERADGMREETELRSPDEDSTNLLSAEAERMFKRASECQAIALDLQSTSPILPFTTAQLCFE